MIADVVLYQYCRQEDDSLLLYHRYRALDDGKCYLHLFHSPSRAGYQVNSPEILLKFLTPCAVGGRDVPNSAFRKAGQTTVMNFKTVALCGAHPCN